MRTVEIKIYEFNELSEKARERALEKYNNPEPEVGIWEIIKEFEKHFYLKVESSDLERYFRIHFYNDDDEGVSSIEGERLYKFIQNNFHNTLYKRKTYKIERRIRRKWRERISKISYQETECPFTGFWLDEFLLDPIREFMRKIEYGITWEELVERCVSNLVENYKEYIEYLESEENFKDNCECNGWEFMEDGTMYNG